MSYFEQFRSNTYAGSGNQFYFEMSENEIRTGRVFYKISVGGTYNYSLLFSNIMDSTYADGSISYKNLVCDRWTIHGARVGRCKSFHSEKELFELSMGGENADIEVFDWKDITFDGQTTKEVTGGEFFTSDPVKHLGKAGKPEEAKYGGHPNEEGCKVWAEALFDALVTFSPRPFAKSPLRGFPSLRDSFCS